MGITALDQMERQFLLTSRDARTSTAAREVTTAAIHLLTKTILQQGDKKMTWHQSLSGVSRRSQLRTGEWTRSFDDAKFSNSDTAVAGRCLLSSYALDIVLQHLIRSKYFFIHSHGVERESCLLWALEFSIDLCFLYNDNLISTVLMHTMLGLVRLSDYGEPQW